MASWPAALAPGWRRYGRPAALIAAKVWASQRVDLTISLACTAVWPGALGVGISRGVRLLIAARMARSVARGAEEEEEEGSSDDDEDAGPAGSSGSGSSRRRAAEPAGPAGQANGVPASSPAKRSGAPARPHKPAPKGLGGMGLPAMLLPVVPPGALACCSVQPVGLPLMLVGQSAARAPLYAARGDRLVRGLVGLAASFLLCRGVHTPFTGRLARLPPRIIERIFHTVVGPAAAMSYLASTAAGGTASSAADRTLCERHKGALQRLYMQLREAGDAEAQRGGRGVVFSSAGPSVEAIQRSDVNACCLPGGIVFVHSGLIRAVQGRPDSLAFVLGHEVGHAIGRHSLEKATSLYTAHFAVDALVGLAERALKRVAPGGENEPWIAARLKTLDGLLQSGMYVLQLGQSRRHEYEADQLALALGAGAGMNSRSLFSGATDVLRRFMRLEAAAGGPAAAAGESDSPLSTHPAAANRLKRLEQLQYA